jgi:hypothetical protein
MMKLSIFVLLFTFLTAAHAQTLLPPAPTATPFGATPTPQPNGIPAPTMTPFGSTPKPLMTPTNLPATPATNRNYNPNNPGRMDNRTAPATGSGN